MPAASVVWEGIEAASTGGNVVGFEDAEEGRDSFLFNLGSVLVLFATTLELLEFKGATEGKLVD